MPARRQRDAVPILEAFGEWLDAQAGHVLPKSPIGQAIAYARAQWQDLQAYTRDGELSIDNNLSERMLRDQAIGRKNYLFVGSDRGAGRRRSCTASWPAASGTRSTRSLISGMCWSACQLIRSTASRTWCRTPGSWTIPGPDARSPPDGSSRSGWQALDAYRAGLYPPVDRVLLGCRLALGHLQPVRPASPRRLQTGELATKPQRRSPP